MSKRSDRFLQASAALTSASSEPDCGRSGKSSEIPGGRASSLGTSREPANLSTSQGSRPPTSSLSTCSAGGSPARPSPRPLADVTLPPGFGPSSPDSFVKWDRDTSSWRTSRGSSVEGGDSGRFSGTWPKAGSMRSGKCYERPTSGRRIIAPECGWLATPTRTANQTSPSMQKHPGCRNYVKAFGAGPIDPSAWEWLMGFPIGWTE